MKRGIKRAVRECEVYQTMKYETLPRIGVLQLLLIPQQAWKDIYMDSIEGLPISHGYTIIFVVVDRFTNYGYFIPLTRPFTSSTVAMAFLNCIFKLYGTPKSIVLD